ncbi:hypothetical protein [Streptomyces sp. NPDC059744]|uniref:hypothetical protein n=1 Tax=Streptomyces sp. NPDC059744 TaxID=3346929 RepID=UPI0036674300
MFLDERAERRRIPPAAIEGVRAAGRHRRTTEIVLTAAQGPANVHAVTHHSVEAVAAFTAALDKPVGQWLTNLRRPGGLGKDPQRAARRAQQLAAIDPDWNPGQLGWTVDWQRHWAGLATLLEGGAGLADIQPGVTHHGDGRPWPRPSPPRRGLRTRCEDLDSLHGLRAGAAGTGR